jgi:hypothetical protein
MKIYRNEKAPTMKDGCIWIHRSKYRDTSSPLIAEVWSGNGWVELQSEEITEDIKEILGDINVLSSELVGHGQAIDALELKIDDLIDSMVSAGFAFMGIAAPTTNPGTPDQKMVYIAVEPGTYTNFGNLVVAEGEVALLKWDSTWTKEVTGIATAAQLNQLGQKANNNKIELRDLTKKTYNIFDCYDYIEKHLYLYPSSPIAENNYTRTLIIPFNVVSGDYFLFYVNGKSGTSKINGLKAGITSSIPSAGDTPSQVITTGMSSVYYRGGFEVSVNGSYVLLQFKYIETYTQQEIDADFAIVVDNLILVKANNSEETYDDYPYIKGKITDVQMENLSQEIKDKFVQTTQSVIYQQEKYM